MSAYFPEISKNFGFGCMRLPMKNGEVDTEQFSKMTDLFWKEDSITLIPRMAICREKVKRQFGHV